MLYQTLTFLHSQQTDWAYISERLEYSRVRLYLVDLYLLQVKSTEDGRIATVFSRDLLIEITHEPDKYYVKETEHIPRRAVPNRTNWMVNGKEELQSFLEAICSCGFLLTKEEQIVIPPALLQDNPYLQVTQK
jgi:hypothetical protein